MTQQVFAPLPPDIEAALRASIEQFGVIVPVVQDQNGNLIDGHNRARIAEELGVPCLATLRTVVDAAEAEQIALDLNSVRRQIGSEQRREMVVALRQQGHSTRAIAGVAKVSQWTVKDDLKKSIERDRSIDLPEQITGLGGKPYAATRPRASWMPLPLSGRGALPYHAGPKDRPVVIRLDNLMSSVRALTSFDPEKVEIGDLTVGAVVMFKREIAGAIKALGTIKRRLEGVQDES